MRAHFIFIPVMFLFCLNGPVHAGYKDDIGYTQLQYELGIANIPNGSGVPVTQAEALYNGAYMPDVLGNTQFDGKTITNVAGGESSVSDHANGVANFFYGNNSSVAPGITTVNVYDAGYWLGGSYLRANSTKLEPLVVSDRIANHSWISNSSDDSEDLEVVKRVDWVVETDEFIHVVGLRNEPGVNLPMLGAAFNTVAVGNTDGEHGRKTPLLDAPYGSGRTRPDLVAPFNFTSTSTPVVSSAASLLVDVGHATPSLSTTPATSNRAGNTVYTAERSEVIKAVLMAGADRVTNNSTNPDPDTPKDITDYRVDSTNQSPNGLDFRFGAGQVNIYDSYFILTAGEQSSAEDDSGGGGNVGLNGFDYDSSFGGDGGSNVKGSYFFSTSTTPVLLTASLVWNVDVAEGGGGPFSNFLGDATLYDMDLRLYNDATGQVVVTSASAIDNTENIWIRLDVNTDYRLEVIPGVSQASFKWDYALAWQRRALIDSDNDGLLDVDEATYGTDPLLPDTDGDGLYDGVEVAGGTDPLLSDTDGDGFDDGMEITYGSDPLLDTSTPADNVNNDGDINGDGTVNVVDVLLATRIVLDELVPTPEQRVRTDMVPDGLINAGDLLRIQQLALGL